MFNGSHAPRGPGRAAGAGAAAPAVEHDAPGLPASRSCIVITVHGRQEQLDAQLRFLDSSLDGGVDADIIVYDDGSPVPILPRPTVRPVVLMRGEANVGLIEARNRVFRRIVDRYEYIMVLDDDVRLYNPAEAIRAGIDHIDRGAGVVSFPYIDLPLRRGARLARFRRILPAGRSSMPCFFGGCCMMSAAALRSVGFLESRYRFGLEEEDYSLRLFAAGVPVHMLHDHRVVAIHDHAGGKQREQRWVMLLSNRYLFHRKFAPHPWLRGVLNALYTLAYLAKTRTPSVIGEAAARYRRERGAIAAQPLPFRVFAAFLLRRYVL